MFIGFFTKDSNLPTLFNIKNQRGQNLGKFEFEEYSTNNHLIVYKIGLEI